MRFPTKKYRRQIEKFTLEQLRSALVREAELRHQAQSALIQLTKSK